MASKFIIIFNNASKIQQDIITQRLKETSYPYWHWMENVWLVTTTDNITAKSFADWLEDITEIPHSDYVVFRVDGPCPYWGRNNNDAWNWMKEIWGPPSD
jgi:hypothetical protein